MSEVAPQEATARKDTLQDAAVAGEDTSQEADVRYDATRREAAPGDAPLGEAAPEEAARGQDALRVTKRAPVLRTTHITEGWHVEARHLKTDRQSQMECLASSTPGGVSEDSQDNQKGTVF